MTSPNDVSAAADDVIVDVNNSSSSNYYYYYYYYHGDDNDYYAGDVQFYYALWTIATPIVFALITVTGVVGNVFVVMVIVTRRWRRQSPTNILLVNLAVADLAFLLICVPFTAVKYAAPSWPLGETTCRMVNYLLYVTVYVTVYTLVAVSALRFVVVVCSTTHLATVLHRATPAVVTSAAVWLLSLVGNSPTYRSFTVKTVGTNATGALYQYCGVVDGGLPLTVLVFFLLGYALPLAVISALYVLIACHVHRHRRIVARPPRATSGRGTGVLRACGGQRSCRTLRLIVVVVVVFGISWLPVHLQSLAAYFGFHSPEGAVYEVFRVLWNCMAYGNSCANPFIYHCGAGGAAAGHRGRSASAARARRQRSAPAATGGRVLSQCCQSSSSFTSTVGRQQRGQRDVLPLTVRTRTTCVRTRRSLRRTYRTAPQQAAAARTDP